MEWRALRKAIVAECNAQNKSEEYTKKYIAYCRKLHKCGLPILHLLFTFRCWSDLNMNMFAVWHIHQNIFIDILVSQNRTEENA